MTAVEEQAQLVDARPQTNGAPESTKGGVTTNTVTSMVEPTGRTADTRRATGGRVTRVQRTEEQSTISAPERRFQVDGTGVTTQSGGVTKGVQRSTTGRTAPGVTA